MSAILFAPHPDDECLFAFYTMMKHDAHVHVLLDSVPSRREEFEAAMTVAGRGWTFSGIREDDPDWDAIKHTITAIATIHDIVISPAVEVGGHEHHNAVGNIVDALDHPRVIRYLTYRRGFGRSKGKSVEPEPPDLMGMKLAALKCYESQWYGPKTQPWFPGGGYGTFEEWVL